MSGSLVPLYDVHRTIPTLPVQCIRIQPYSAFPSSKPSDVAPVFVTSPDCQFAARVHQTDKPQAFLCELHAAEFIEVYQSKPARSQALLLYVFLLDLMLRP